MKIKRRKFIKSSLQSTGALYLSGLSGCQAESTEINPKSSTNHSKVIISQNENVRDKNNKLIQSQVANLLNSTIENFFEVSKAEKGWQKLFNKNDVVGIKVNCLAGRGI